jgi:NAD+ synthase
MQLQDIARVIVDFITKEVEKRESQGVVVGLSGGLDSSIAASLAVRAVGANCVFALILPDSPITPKTDIYDAQQLAKNLKIKYKTIEIGTIKRKLLAVMPKNKLAQGNFSSRLRMCIIYYYAGIMHRLVLGTSDKSEIKLGYYTKNGDGAADIFPIADLYKTEVRQLAGYLRLPVSIIEKKSSPRLWRGQTAEDEIGLNYEQIDEILRKLDANTLKKPKSKSNPSTKNIQMIMDLIDRNKHKLEPAPVCKLYEYNHDKNLL